MRRTRERAAGVAVLLATILPMDLERELSNQTVIVRDGRIAAGVVLGGRWLPRAGLDRLLDQVAASAAAQPE